MSVARTGTEWGRWIQTFRTYDRADPYERLMANVIGVPGSGCWAWIGKGTKNGYAVVGSGGKYGTGLYGHRVTYERNVGPIPDGHQLHHECEFPRCVNPRHLEPVTMREHRREHGLGTGPCNQCGADDWYIRKDTGARMCRECKRIRRRRAAC